MITKEIKIINSSERMERPREFNPNNVCYWEETSKTLRSDPKTNTFVSKARKFLQAGCIEKVGSDKWICKPIKDYNNTTHNIEMDGDKLTCSCQGYNKKENDYQKGISELKPFCSHTVAVKQFCFLEANQ